MPFDHVTVTTPPRLRSVFVWALPEDGAFADVVEVVEDFLAVVVVDDFVDFFWSVFDRLFESGLAVVAVVDDDGGAAETVTVVVLDGDGTAAAVAVAASARDPAAAPGRGSVLAGDAGTGVDVGPAEGLAGAASVGGDVGGTAVSGDGAGAAISASGASGVTGTDRAAWRARTTSGCDSGETRAVENRDETSCTPNSPKSTPLAVPRAHVTTRTRRTAKWWRLPPHGGVKTMLNQRQGSRLRG